MSVHQLESWYSSLICLINTNFLRPSTSFQLIWGIHLNKYGKQGWLFVKKKGSCFIPGSRITEDARKETRCDISVITADSRQPRKTQSQCSGLGWNKIYSIENKTDCVWQGEHETPFRACLDGSLVCMGSWRGDDKGRCSSKHGKKRKKERGGRWESEVGARG